VRYTPPEEFLGRSRFQDRRDALAAGHPFAATGGRILAQAAKQLFEKREARKEAKEGGGTVRALISICAAGGQGVAAILEA